MKLKKKEDEDWKLIKYYFHKQKINFYQNTDLLQSLKDIITNYR